MARPMIRSRGLTDIDLYLMNVQLSFEPVFWRALFTDVCWEYIVIIGIIEGDFYVSTMCSNSGI